MTRRLAEPFRAVRAQRAVVAIGANLGDTTGTIHAAVRELGELPLTGRVVCSDPVESVAVTVDGPDPTKPGYLNAVALVDTRIAPSILLAELHRIEARHGRVRRERWGDRTLDLDLIAYGDVSSDDPRLTLPHPHAHERDFVLAPWYGVDPRAILPGRGAVGDLLRAVREGR